MAARRMASRLLLGVWTLAGCLCLGAEAKADGLRCGSQLASRGDSTYEVRGACGEPDAAIQRVEIRTFRRRVPVACPVGSRRRHCEVVVEESIPVVIDEWTYDFGRNRFIEFVTFEQNRLVRVSTGGYGRKDPS